MKYTKLGKSNLTVSRVCIGTMHFGPRTSEQEAFRIMDKALDMGINFFDTANVYGGEEKGRSETIIGNWFQQNPANRDRVVLATKVYGNMKDPSIPNEGPGISAYKVRKHVEASLQRLQTDHIDLYQVHHIDRRITPEEFWGTFDRLIDDGKVLYMGSSNYPGWGLAKFQMQALQRGSMGFVSEQTMFSLLCRYPELEVFPAALDFGIGIIPYMPLAGGLLSGKMKAQAGSRTSDVEREYGITLGESNQQMAAFSALCQEIGEKEHVVAIAWTLSRPAVASPIVGVRTEEHLDGLDRAAELELEPEVLAKLDAIFTPNSGRPLRVGQAPEAYAW
ncbi:MAG: aldo/keto reductase [Anaerolineae bacterium]|nr:aldo/keto reductase [Anaerolineae bacterium]